MRLRLLATLLILPGCFLLTEEEPEAPPPGEGGGGEPIVCDGRDEIDCAGLACGDTAPCGRECRNGCLVWRVKTPSDESAQPPSRSSPTIVCDEARGVLWVYGGEEQLTAEPPLCVQRIVPRGDLWQVAPAGDHLVWTLVSSGDEPGAPPPRAAATLLVDARGTLWLFGGLTRVDQEQDCARSHEVRGDLYRFDGDAWIEQGPEVLRPTPRAAALRVDDPERQRVRLVGGIATIEPNQQTWSARDAWEWDPGTIERDAAFVPLDGAVFDQDEVLTPLVWGAAGWAGPNRGMVFFGGRLADQHRVPGRSYETTTWRHPSAGGLLEPLPNVWLPSPREGLGAASVPGLGVVAYDGWLSAANPAFLPDVVRDRTLLLRDDGDFVELPGGGRVPAGTHPGVRHLYGMTWCGALGGAVLFAGENAGGRPGNQLFVLQE